MLVLYAPAGFALFVFQGLALRHLQALGPWLWTWSSLFVLSTWLLLDGVLEPLLVLQGLLALLFAIVVSVKSTLATLLGLTAGLTVVVVFGGIERELSRQMWLDAASPQVLIDKLSGISRLSGDSPGWRHNGIRWIEKAWLLKPGSDGLQLSFEARLTEGTVGWQWYTNRRETAQEFHVEDGTPFTRIVNAPAERRYIAQRVRTEEPVAGRTFRASLEMRAPHEVAADGCDGLRLRTFETSFQHCEGLNLTQEWQRYEIEATFPKDARQPAFDLIVNDIDTEMFDIRDVRILEYREDTWSQVAHVEPAGLHVRLPLAGVHIFSHPTLNLIPQDDWQRYALVLDRAELDSLREASFLLQLESGVDVAIRAVSLSPLDPEAPAPIARAFSRFDLWFPHANLAGHTLLAAGLLLLLVAQGPMLGLGGTGLIFTAIFLTGSRAAWGGALLGVPWLLWLVLHGRPRLLVFAVLGIGSLALVFGPGVDVLGRLQVWTDQDGSPVARSEMWGVALQGLVEHPWSGLKGQGEDFATYWQAAYRGDSTQTVTHAHNLWLAFASDYGVPGLVAITWLTGALLYLAWRWGRWRGMAVVLPVFAINIFDYTFFYPGVLLALILALNVLRDQRQAV